MADTTMPKFDVEVVFASPEVQALRRVTVPQGCTAAEAISASGLYDYWLNPSGAPFTLSRFGRLIAPEQVLMAGDRVEILRPLCADPKDQRHERVREVRRARSRAAS